jgi:hypothetical protein
MPAKPSTPHAAEILQNFWEDLLDPAELTRRSIELERVSAELIA